MIKYNSENIDKGENLESTVGVWTKEKLTSNLLSWLNS